MQFNVSRGGSGRLFAQYFGTLQALRRNLLALNPLPIRLQKATFRAVKGHLSSCKRWPFMAREMPFGRYAWLLRQCGCLRTPKNKILFHVLLFCVSSGLGYLCSVND